MDTQQILGAIHSPIRRRILALIWDRQLPATAIAETFELSAPTISQHLAVLRRAGLVTMTAKGNFRLYQARQDVLRELNASMSGQSSKWVAADDLPETALAGARTQLSVVAWVDVDASIEATFSAWIDAVAFSRWIGAPVTLRDGRFSCEMEWGTRIEGTYDHVIAPSLLALRWNFDDANVPIPGADMYTYVRFSSLDSGCHVEVHHIAEGAEQAAFMEVAWTMVLGRLKSGLPAALDPRTPAEPRPARPKRRN